jgi:hypothetical protein
MNTPVCSWFSPQFMAIKSTFSSQDFNPVHIRLVGPKQQELIPLQAGDHMTPVTIDYTSGWHFVGVY